MAQKKSSVLKLGHYQVGEGNGDRETANPDWGLADHCLAVMTWLYF